jgi:hypothetical protein
MLVLLSTALLCKGTIDFYFDFSML